MESVSAPPKKITKTTQPHDKLIKKLLSNPAVMQDILKMYLPEEILQRISLSDLHLQPDSFIDDQHRLFAVDLLFKTSVQGEEGYIWILVEHQSKMDEWLPVRVFVYTGLIWNHIRKISKAAKIPLIYPLIIYNGSKPYSKPLALKELIHPESSRVLFENLFNKPLDIIDLAKMDTKTLQAHSEEHIRGTALLLTMKHVFDKNLPDEFMELLHIYKYLDQSGYRDETGDMLYYLLNESKHLTLDHLQTVIHQNFSEPIEDTVMTLAQALRQQGKQEGIQKGIQEGMQEGIQKGIQKGIQQGKQQGSEETAILIAERLLTQNADCHFISAMTGLPLEKIYQLQCK